MTRGLISSGSQFERDIGYSRAVVDGDWIFVSGTTGFNYETMTISDNLLDQTHAAYVHKSTLASDTDAYARAEMEIVPSPDGVKFTRWMLNCIPPGIYSKAVSFKGRVDRWQEVEFHVSHLLIWTGATDAGAGNPDSPELNGFHIRGFHGVTPETDTSTHHFWTVATNPHPERSDAVKVLVEQTANTFNEDKVVIEAQWRNQHRFPAHPQVDIHIDAGRTTRRLSRRKSRSAGDRPGETAAADGAAVAVGGICRCAAKDRGGWPDRSRRRLRAPGDP